MTRVQAMGEESLSPDNFEGLMRALEALKTTRNVDAGSEDPRKQMLEEIRQSLKGLILVQGKGLPLGYPCDWVDAILDEMEAKL